MPNVRARPAIGRESMPPTAPCGRAPRPLHLHLVKTPLAPQAHSDGARPHRCKPSPPIVWRCGGEGQASEGVVHGVRWVVLGHRLRWPSNSDRREALERRVAPPLIEELGFGGGEIHGRWAVCTTVLWTHRVRSRLVQGENKLPFNPSSISTSARLMATDRAVPPGTT